MVHCVDESVEISISGDALLGGRFGNKAMKNILKPAILLPGI